MATLKDELTALHDQSSMAAAVDVSNISRFINMGKPIYMLSPLWIEG